MTKLTKKGYEKYPVFSGLTLRIIAEDDTRYRIKSKKGEKWIDKSLFENNKDKKEEEIKEEENHG
jgi:hypothetical protein